MKIRFMLATSLALAAGALSSCGEPDPKVLGSCMVRARFRERTSEQTIQVNEACQDGISIATCEDETFESTFSSQQSFFDQTMTCADRGYTVPCGGGRFAQQASDC